tara:strand:+ start:867 stop:2021 length:1155 start_codon:yes stop_codon:yes gene_type:complete
MEISFLNSIDNISEEAWNSVIDSDYPFIQYSFLKTLESTNCVGEGTGWLPFHLIIKEDDLLVGIMPLYLKTDSHGEFIFDWSWANAFFQNGLDYYPKLVSAIPFTPAQGPRLCLINENKRIPALQKIRKEIEVLASNSNISSMHILLPRMEELDFYKETGFSQRTSYSFHWFNNGYESFEGFLEDLTSRQRKNIKKEREKVLKQSISLEKLDGGSISEGMWNKFYEFYQATYYKRGMRPYLNLDFFKEISSVLPDSILLVMAKNSSNQYVAGALNFLDSSNLYGRYWGCLDEYDSLHFEACYYQGIDFCIDKGLKRFDPGVQGEHKIRRGFWPIETYSAHWIKDLRFREAIDKFLLEEEKHIKNYTNESRTLLPYKSSIKIKRN